MQINIDIFCPWYTIQLRIWFERVGTNGYQIITVQWLRSIRAYADREAKSEFYRNEPMVDELVPNEALMHAKCIAHRISMESPALLVNSWVFFFGCFHVEAVILSWKAGIETRQPNLFKFTFLPARSSIFLNVAATFVLYDYAETPNDNYLHWLPC